MFCVRWRRRAFLLHAGTCKTFGFFNAVAKCARAFYAFNLTPPPRPTPALYPFLLSTSSFLRNLCLHMLLSTLFHEKMRPQSAFTLILSRLFAPSTTLQTYCNYKNHSSSIAVTLMSCFMLCNTCKCREVSEVD